MLGLNCTLLAAVLLCVSLCPVLSGEINVRPWNVEQSSGIDFDEDVSLPLILLPFINHPVSDLIDLPLQYVEGRACCGWAGLSCGSFVIDSQVMAERKRAL